MTRVYRILRKPYSNRPFDGEGPFRFGSRWSSSGTRLAYAAEHLSLAMIEYFVHIDADDPPRDLVVVSADILPELSRQVILPAHLPPQWRRTPAPPELASIGDGFVAEGRSAILLVPSAIAPAEFNWLINPAHAGFPRITIQPRQDFEYDSRFFKQRN